MQILLLGKPGSGKGTQAKRLADRLGIPSISTGDLFRRAIAENTELGRQCKSYLDQGLLVPDVLVLAVVQEQLASPLCAKGFLLDGFPRTVPQAEALSGWLAAQKKPSLHALLIDVPTSILLERAVGRRYCVKDGSSYHVRYAPSKDGEHCDMCGGPLVQREDDTEPLVRQRIEQYETKTYPLIAYYGGKSCLYTIDGIGTPQEVESRIETVFAMIQRA